ncbi:hypothetical protein [Ideonella livida]|uniref:Outer membrane protein beta-barrel domain-containing protein n=1 Tax=Ideonella livida TaxID=2707176 RepID=A0A7C9PEJ1_9BURK|nr:hypothetical protein [Ideonella livida]NDY89897.1 hypothetical protein [Ideonella livida]
MMRHALAAAALLAAASAQAYEFKPADLLGTQANFKLFSQDVSAAMAYKSFAPAEGLGITGFDLNLSAHATQLQSVKVLEQAAGTSSVPTALPTVAVRAQKGLPFDIDIGASYETIPTAGVSAFGGEIKWAFLGGSMVMPAVAVRAYGSKVSGITDMGMTSTGVDLSISKGFAIFKPYAGVGVMRTKATDDSGKFASETYNQTRTFVGANINLVIMDVGLQADKIGDNTAYSVKLGFRF